MVVHGRADRRVVRPGRVRRGGARANRVKVNRAHDLRAADRPGRRVASVATTDGLVAETADRQAPRSATRPWRWPPTDCSEASIGFAVMPGGERWLEGRSRRRLERLFLDHIALVPEPAYDAQVLAVRGRRLRPTSPPVPTPNLDEVLAWLGR